MAAAQSTGINAINSKKNNDQIKEQNIPPTLEVNKAASLPKDTINNNDNPLKPVEFVVIKSELDQEWPAIWMADKKPLLQKFEPFDQNGATLYKSISTYTSWTPESKKQYISIPVRCISHTQNQNEIEMVVEFLRSDMAIVDHDYQDKCMKEYHGYRDNFAVYIQTLISQALDCGFLADIFQEKEDYFMSNLKPIDDIIDSKKRKLQSVLKWPPSLQAAVCTWPCVNVDKETCPSGTHGKSCAACGKSQVSVRVLMCVEPYNPTTLEACQPDPMVMNEEKFLMCKTCAVHFELLYNVTHQKYLMYLECAKRVNEKRRDDPRKDVPRIFDELLTDEVWHNQLFLNMRTLWAKIDCLERTV